MAIKLLTFDLDHTLWDPDAALLRGEQASHAWLAQQVPAFGEHFPPAAFVDLRLQLRQQNPALAHRVSELRREAFRHALRAVGKNSAEADALAAEAFAVFWRCRQQVALYPESVRLLQQLSQCYTLGALSNGNACLTAVGLAAYFRFHFAGEDFAAAKPAPDMFLAALTRTGVAPHEALHIGDHPVDDMQGARAVGMQTLWINLAGKPWPLDTPAPDFSVTQLAQILTLLSPGSRDACHR